MLINWRRNEYKNLNPYDLTANYKTIIILSKNGTNGV